MEAAQDGASSASVTRPAQTQFQSMDDFMKEQEDLDSQRAAEAESYLAMNPTKKQKKAFERVERERLDAERRDQKASIPAEREKLEGDRLIKKATTQAEGRQLEEERIAKKVALQIERERLETERVTKKAAVQVEMERLEAERNALKANIQIERELLEAEKKMKETALELEKLSIEQQASKAVEEMGARNWIGLLLEYRNAHRALAGGLLYTESVAPLAYEQLRFKCTVVIPEIAQPFGSGISFSNKKSAKRYAAKKAIDWLIENGHMPADGSVKFPKQPPLPVVTPMRPVLSAATMSPVGTPKPAKTTSYAGQIPELCVRLGFGMPTYEITKQAENLPFWSGYAHFQGDPRIEGKFGEVKSIHGKGNAKEQIAMEVLSFLKDIERQRMEMDDDDDDDEEDKKRKRSSASSDTGETPGKFVKVAA